MPVHTSPYVTFQGFLRSAITQYWERRGSSRVTFLALLLATREAWGVALDKTLDVEAGKKVLRVGFPVAETGFDPVRLSDVYSVTVTAHIFEALYGYDHLARPARLRPLTAAGMPEASDDFRVWTVRLQPGIFFADDPAFGGRRRELVAAGFRRRVVAAAAGARRRPGAAAAVELRFRRRLDADLGACGRPRGGVELMAARGYPDLTDHKRAHDGFDRRLNQFHERFQWPCMETLIFR